MSGWEIHDLEGGVLHIGTVAAALAAGVLARAKLDALLADLREVQRAKFRGGDEDGLLATADAIAGIMDTALVTKDAIEQTLSVAADMRAFGGSAGSSATIVSLSNGTKAVLDVLEKVNKAWATFQLARAAVDLVSGSKTEAEGGRKAVAAMATTVSAGGTLLGASVGFTLYSNLYIGPMVGACLSMLSKIENMISKGSNRQWMEAGNFEMVNWSLEPGGREVFNFMLAVMNAGGSADIPNVPAFVDTYFVDNEDDLNAGVGKKGGEMPTEGWWFWEETKKDKIKGWVFRNRASLWGMFYGAAKVPSGGPML